MATSKPSAGDPGPPPVDPEFAAALEAMAQLADAPPLTLEGIPERRAAHAAAFVPPDPERGGAFRVQEAAAPGPDGAPDVPLLVCRPVRASGPRPVVYYVHGGGMFLGGPLFGLEEVLDWAEEFGAVVVSADYRLAPENPHPAPVEDCYAGLLWTAKEAAGIGADPDRIVIAGGSAGGGLAAATALLARDRGGPALLGQLLACPMLDDRDATASTAQMAGARLPWNREANRVGWTALLGDRRGGPDVSPYAAPARAEDLSGLPPAFLDTGSAETFRTEVIDYAERIWSCGGRAELHVWPGGVHGFDSLVPEAALSRDARRARTAWLHRLLDA
ncbi:alpha/beta hydrolase [Nocardiopsis composta]|uniref:Acetyl esterase/lipase n=1 Tax=Nocardiopsis composta TaxID=157465 RepID=A0A7W8VDT8_9ACTN|nr:alpha/beta hydrolase [Nocardiopsis composta]MBB5432400.1 acetyl esterase/lipase [Nocardiopsis composta]